MGIFIGLSTKWLFIHLFQITLEFRNVGFAAPSVIKMMKPMSRNPTRSCPGSYMAANLVEFYRIW